MESGEIINNSYKDFGERESNQTTVGKNKCGLKKVIIISVIIYYNNYFMNKIIK